MSRRKSSFGRRALRILGWDCAKHLRTCREAPSPCAASSRLACFAAVFALALVACLGLLPAALSTSIGSDSQKRFAIVVVAGLNSRLFLGRIVSPVLYQMVAREGDVLQV